MLQQAAALLMQLLKEQVFDGTNNHLLCSSLWIPCFANPAKLQSTDELVLKGQIIK